MTTQRHWTEVAVRNLSNKAHEAGLLDLSVSLVYVPGSRINGNAPAIVAVDEKLGRSDYQPSWLPVFLEKDTARTVERMADAQTHVLYSILLNEAFRNALHKQD